MDTPRHSGGGHDDALPPGSTDSLPRPERPPARRRRAAIAATVMLLGVGLLATEAVVRLALPYSTPEQVRRYSVPYEASLFTRYRLAAAGRMVEVDPDKAWGLAPEDADAERRFYINDLGFRGPAFDAVKPEGTVRVFVLGGSSVFDQNVSDPSPSEGGTWPDRAEALLRERGLDVEVVNAGTPAFSTIDAIGRLVSEVWVYEPDVVVLYNGWNDIKNFRAWEVSPQSPLMRIMAPYEPEADPYRHFQGSIDRMLGHSQLYMKVRTAVLDRRVDVAAEGYLPQGEAGSTYGPWGLRQFEQNVLNFIAIARNMGAVPVVMTQATPITGGELVDEALAADYQLLDPEGLARAFDEVHSAVRAAARERDASLLDASAALGAEPRWFADHVHLTPEGSEALARLLANHLEPIVRSAATGEAEPAG